MHVIYQDVPAFIYAVVGNVVTYAGEESVVNPHTKTMSLRTKNLSMNMFVSVDEFCTYTQCTDNHDKTQYTKSLVINGLLTGFINYRLENWFVDTDVRNRKNGISVMDEIIGGVSQLLLPLQQQKM